MQNCQELPFFFTSMSSKDHGLSTCSVTPNLAISQSFCSTIACIAKWRHLGCKRMGATFHLSIVLHHVSIGALALIYCKNVCGKSLSVSGSVPRYCAATVRSVCDYPNLCIQVQTWIFTWTMHQASITTQLPVMVQMVKAWLGTLETRSLCPNIPHHRLGSPTGNCCVATACSVLSPICSTRMG